MDPLELSTISDVSCREGLHFISEDTPPGGCHQDEDLGKDGKKDWSSTKLHSSSSKLMRSTSQVSFAGHVHLFSGGKFGLLIF